MKIIIVLVMVGVSMSPLIARAGERQEDRIEQLERDNYRLSMEVNRLRGELRQYQQRASHERYRRYGYPGSGYGLPSPYGTQNPMGNAARQMDEANRMKRSWENLKR